MTLSVVAVAMVALPLAFEPERPRDLALRAAVAAAAVAACHLTDGTLALGAVAVGLLLHAAGAGSRTGAVGLGLAAAAAATAAAALATEASTVAWVASLVSLAIRVGLVPVHLATGALARRKPAALIGLGGTTVAATLVHLEHVAPTAHQLAYDHAATLVVIGAVSAFIAGLTSLSQVTLRGLWSASTSAHGGMLFAAVAAAGRGHQAAAVFVATAFALALGGFGLLLVAIEARTGPVALNALHGRSTAFPRLTWSFAFFSAASVAMPGTIGFAADDLLLHALWAESPVACGLILGASALLAVGLLRAFGHAFLGTASTRWTAPDLGRREAVAVAALLTAVIGFGLRPMWLLNPTLAHLPVASAATHGPLP